METFTTSGCRGRRRSSGPHSWPAIRDEGCAPRHSEHLGRGGSRVNNDYEDTLLRVMRERSLALPIGSRTTDRRHTMASYILRNARLLFQKLLRGSEQVRKHGQNVLCHSSPDKGAGFSGGRLQCPRRSSLVTGKRNPHLSSRSGFVTAIVPEGHSDRRWCEDPLDRGHGWSAGLRGHRASRPEVFGLPRPDSSGIEFCTHTSTRRISQSPRTSLI